MISPIIVFRWTCHVVVSAGARPAIDKTADVSVDGVDVGPRTINVVDEAGDSVAFWRPTVDV